MVGTLTADQAIAMFGYPVEDFSGAVIPDKVDVVDLSELHRRLPEGRYKFVALRRLPDGKGDIGGLAISTLLITPRNKRLFSHEEIAAAVGYKPEECFGGVLIITSTGQVDIDVSEGQSTSLAEVYGGDAEFEKAFALARNVSVVVGVCTVSPGYLTERDLQGLKL